MGSPASTVATEHETFGDLFGDALECMMYGIQTMTVSVSVLHFFTVHVNTAGPITKCLHAGQYGVYVLQTIFIPLVMCTWTRILAAIGHPQEFYVCEYFPISSSPLSQDLIIVGWLYTITLVNLLSWPFAYFFRKLPFVSGVL